MFEPTVLLSIAAIVVLLVLSGLFSGSETALTASSRARMHHLEKRGNRKASIVNRLTERKERLIGAILLGNNLVNIFASALATSVLISFFGDAGVAIATLVMTLAILVFAEVLPKTYALRSPDRTALALAPVLGPIVWLLSPFSRGVQLIIRLILRLAGIAVDDLPDSKAAAEEIRGTIALHTSEGAMVKADRDMLDSILDLDEVQVGEIMIHRSNMQIVDADDPPAAIIEQALASSFTRIPLWRDEPEDIIGILHVKDLLRVLAAEQGKTDNIDIAAIAGEPWFVPETTTLREQLNAFRERRSHFALVVDEYGALMGMVTLEDILEEIVGEIVDEHDVAVTGVRSQSDGSYVVDGSVTIRDLNRQFDWDLPDEEASTIAGLLIHEARVIPEVGQLFSFYNFRFEVLGRRKNRLTVIRVKPQLSTRAASDR